MPELIETKYNFEAWLELEQSSGYAVLSEVIASKIGFSNAHKVLIRYNIWKEGRELEKEAKDLKVKVEDKSDLGKLRKTVSKAKKKKKKSKGKE